ncbi:MAG: ABC transporter ATP-binding protein [Actinobacteria bacterium]|jgi:ABC-2 type transport system ATP-binding protein|nr:MAG: ABC transporter ATP-binding protein [Actinomycetota bacterium]
MPAISIRDLKKHYGDVKAVDGITLEVEEREIFGILGPNGAGKTTTLEMVETLREPDSGEIEVLGIDTRAEPRAIKELIGVQLQTTVFFDNLKVRETIDLFSSFYPRTLDLDELLDIAALADKAGAMVSDLSGGQHKRLSIALALVNDPRVVFLDEPTTGLDPQARRRIWEIVEGLRGQDKTVVITTHYIEEAEYLCDRVAVMDHGKIIALGTPYQLIDEHVSDSIITFRLDPPVEEEIVRRLHGVVGVQADDGDYRVTTAVPQETLIGIVAMAHEQGVRADDINMKRATLEDVFLKITGRRIRE